MLRRCLTLGLPLIVGLLLLAAQRLQSQLWFAVAALLLIGLSIEIAHRTTEQAAHYGASGMVAGMAAMMAAMGTGLTIGYATGMVWDLGWANLVGVLSGLTHALVMGRRYGPMAALDGAGGGVMGGLMGPMLDVMLLYLPTSLLLTGVLMLALLAAFSLGGLYLIAAAAGAVGSSGLLYQVGRLLGAHDLSGPLKETVCSAPPTPQPMPARKVKPAERARQSKSRHPTEHRSLIPLLIAGAAGAVAFLVIVRGTRIGGASSATSPSAGSFAAAVNAEPVVATVGPDGVQQLSMTLRYPRYEPRLLEVKAGTPVRLSLEAIGEPG